jgi:23S rRNA (cytidine2498-2'-O)-methyltransferase
LYSHFIQSVFSDNKSIAKGALSVYNGIGCSVLPNIPPKAEDARMPPDKAIITYYPGFRRQAWDEAVKAGAANPRELARGLAAVDIPPFRGYAGLLACLPPIFIRHIMPVFESGELTGRRDEDLSRMLETAANGADIETGALFCVQCRIIGGSAEYRAKDVEVRIGEYFDAWGAVPRFSDYDVTDSTVAVISVLILDTTYYAGVCSSVEALSSHCDEYRVLSREGRVISRAENKLREAVAKYKLALPGGRALDIGASPGGWTNVLASHGYLVTAVDPGQLHPSLNDNPKVSHIKEKIQNVAFEAPFDLIVNDMNISPEETARVTAGVSVFLKRGGAAVITIKLPFADAFGSIEKAAVILNEKYDIAAVNNLTHNRAEVTALLYKL